MGGCVFSGPKGDSRGTAIDHTYMQRNARATGVNHDPNGVVHLIPEVVRLHLEA